MKLLIMIAIVVSLMSLYMLPWKVEAALSTAWERGYVNSKRGEIYVEYPPDVYYDPDNPDADTKFPIKFSVRMKRYWYNTWYNMQPDYFKVTVYIDDRTDYVSEWYVFDMMKFYPVSTQEFGTKLTYSFSVGGDKGSLTINVESSSTSFDWSYEHKNYAWDKLGWLYLDYKQDGWPWSWSEAYSEGCIVIAVHNDDAISRNGHRINIKLVFELGWQDGPDWYPGLTHVYTYTFIIGDDTPADGDCYLDLVPGSVNEE